MPHSPVIEVSKIMAMLVNNYKNLTAFSKFTINQLGVRCTTDPLEVQLLYFPRTLDRFSKAFTIGKKRWVSSFVQRERLSAATISMIYYGKKIHFSLQFSNL